MPLLTGQNVPRFSQYTSDQFAGNGSQTTYTLTRTPPNAVSLLVTIDGVKQHSSTYTLGVNQIVFTEAPPSGSSIECIAIGLQGLTITPGDNTVSSSSLINGSVTKSKLDVKALDGTGAVVIPSGTTAQRPAGEPGAIRHNSSTGLLEYYDNINSKWTGVGEFAAIGGNTITEVGGYRIHTFTSSGTFQVVSGTGAVEYLVVAGGAGGGSSFGGGGGAGGFRTNVPGSTSGRGSAPEGAMTIAVGSYSVVVGAGGTAPLGNAEGIDGGDSSFNGIVSLGGGGGGCQGVYTPVNVNGGCGGGLSHNSGVGNRGLGTTGQGYDSGACYNGGSPYSNPGGGGAGEIGQTPTNASTSVRGGNGQVSSITGSNVTYAGGGGGGGGGPSYNTNTSTAYGGAGGGGAGGPSASTDGYSGTANTGGGGGGSHSYNDGARRGGYGGSGIVIIRYKITA